MAGYHRGGGVGVASGNPRDATADPARDCPNLSGEVSDSDGDTFYSDRDYPRVSVDSIYSDDDSPRVSVDSIYFDGDSFCVDGEIRNVDVDFTNLVK